MSAAPGRRRAVLAALALAAGSAHAQGPCTPDWSSGFGAASLAGDWSIDRVNAYAAFDDGSGLALYVAGAFTTSSSGAALNHIARWDGTGWAPLGSGTDGEIRALTVHDDGSGPALWAAGAFTTAGGVAAAGVARWNGSWSPVGSPVTAGSVQSLLAFDDGSGPALVAAGDLGAPSIGATGVMRWNGTQWSALGAGLAGRVDDLIAFDDGTGNALHAAGTSGLSRWNGNAWSTLSACPTTRLAVYDEGAGAGPRLHAIAGCPLGYGIARWQAGAFVAIGYVSPWSLNGIPEPDAPSALRVHDDGTGSRLYVAGAFDRVGAAHYGPWTEARGIASWDGSTWSPVGGGLAHAYTYGSHENGYTPALDVLDLGQGPRLVCDGRWPFLTAWDGTSWSSPVWAGGAGLDGPVHALQSFDDGTGLALYAGGDFATAGGVAANGIARFDGTGWSAVGGGIAGRVTRLTTYDLGSGPELWAIGRFRAAGGGPAFDLAAWNGTSWSAPPAPFPPPLDMQPPGFLAVAGFDDGTGPALYIGGRIRTTLGQELGVLRWTGTQWQDFGPNPTTPVRAFQVFDDGTGAKLHMAVGESGVRRWSGTQWDIVGFLPGIRGRSMAVFDDQSGHGPELYVGGGPDSPSSLSRWLYRWRLGAWSILGGGVSHAAGTPSVDALAVLDDGTGPGPVLVASGRFTHGGGVPVDNVAWWDGQVWRPLAGSTPLGTAATDQIRALAPFDAGAGGVHALAVGGTFTALESVRSVHFGRRITCATDFTSTCAGDGLDAAVTTPCPCGNAGAPGRGCANSVNASGALLAASGSTAVDPGTGTDTVVLAAGGMPGIASVAAIFLQGDATLPGGILFGDGVRCADGLLTRLGSKATPGGMALFPEPGDASVSQRGAVTPGSGALRHYQTYYRNAASTFCPPATFNVTSGVRVTW